jgi:predicted esterase
MHAEIEGLSGQHTCFSYFDLASPGSCRDALERLEDHVVKFGPYMGMMAFSEGAAVAATFILSEATKGLRPIKFAIFMSGGVPADPVALKSNKIELLSLGSQGSYSISIPTVNVYGATDPGKDEFGIALSAICQANTNVDIVHGGGHEIPGRKMGNTVSDMLSAIKAACGKDM